MSTSKPVIKTIPYKMGGEGGEGGGGETMPNTAPNPSLFTTVIICLITGAATSSLFGFYLPR